MKRKTNKCDNIVVLRESACFKNKQKSSYKNFTIKTNFILTKETNKRYIKCLDVFNRPSHFTIGIKHEQI